MEFELTEEQKMIQELARDFANREIAPIAAKIDETGEFPHETVKKMGELGLMGLQVSPEYGGAGADAISYVLAVKEISKVCASHGVIMSVNNSLVCYGIETFGTEEQKKRFLEPLASGKVLGAFSLTEPQAGSDAGNLKCSAKREGDEYVINGTKSWVTSGPVAKYIILFAVTDPSKGHKGITAFIVDTDLPGFKVGKIEPKLGIRASHTSEIHFDNYRIPVSHRLGEEGDGFKIAMTILDMGRIGIAAQALGIAEAAYEASARYAYQRVAFGKPIIQHEAVMFTLADMATRIEAAQLVTLKAAYTKMVGKRVTKYSSMAKVFAAETAMWVTTKAIQIHGGMGYSKELPIERYFRDAKITEIYEGTSEIQRLVIGRQIIKELEAGLL